MKGRKKIIWVLAISAALVTAGLSLSCGDENGENGDAAVSCQEACENLWECGWIPYFGYYFGFTVRECVYSCKEEIAGDGGGFTELYQCISDADCDDLGEDCFYQPLCEKLIVDCEFWGGTVSDCVDYCYDAGEYCIFLTLCSLAFSSCQYIEGSCPLY